LGSTHLAIVKNFEALAEGATNAPRIENAALVAPTAGSNIILRIQENEFQVSANTFPDVGNHNRASASQHLGFTVLIAGTVRTRFETRFVTGSGIGGAVARVLKNGIQVAVTPALGFSTSYTVREFDISVAVGDKIIYQIRAADSGNNQTYAWRNLEVRSGTITAAVA
jgi:hypothetical protein